ncbi:hypothetical protein ACV33M_30460, partial [Pseudomonas aeruginosa]
MFDEQGSGHAFLLLGGDVGLGDAAEHPLATQPAQKDPQLQAFIDECKRAGVAEDDIATQEKKGMATYLFGEHPLDCHEPRVCSAN